MFGAVDIELALALEHHLEDTEVGAAQVQRQITACLRPCRFLTKMSWKHEHRRVPSSQSLLHLQDHLIFHRLEFVLVDVEHGRDFLWARHRGDAGLAGSFAKQQRKWIECHCHVQGQQQQQRTSCPAPHCVLQCTHKRKHTRTQRSHITQSHT